MKSNDTKVKTMDELRQELQEAIRADDANRFGEVFGQISEAIYANLQAEMKDEMDSVRQSADNNIRAARGERLLTSQEREYYQKLITAMNSPDPKQALANADLVFPETVIDAVFEDLRTDHPLLSKINFIPTGAAIKMIYNENGYQQAAWGELCDEIVKEIASGFKVVETGLFKLSAIMYVCKEALTLGPAWLDRYVREVLYETFANGLEAGAIDGDGNKKIIGMDRQVGDNVTVTGGVYPKKTAIVVTALDLQTMGNLVSLLAQAPNGGSRPIRNLILVANPVDYFKRVVPAVTVQGPDGTYRQVLPYPMDIIQSPGVPLGEAMLGLGYRYFASIGSPKDGTIEYSDHYKFAEDVRTYIIKGYANGFPMDNNAFLRLDISGLQPALYKVVAVDERTPSNVATLASLSLGAAALSPAFASGTTTYTASTTNASNVVNAVPTDAGADIEIKLGTTVVANGSAVTWATGSNTLTVTVTAEDGTTTKTYTVTVTKS